MAKKIKISVTVTLEVDSEAWVAEYGMKDTSAKAVRADVKAYVAERIDQSYPVLNGIVADAAYK